MLKVKQADYMKISKDFRGIIDGKRSCFAGCLIKGGGTVLIIEGKDFEIIPTPSKKKLQRKGS
jgi:hypothetical protein